MGFFFLSGLSTGMQAFAMPVFPDYSVTLTAYNAVAAQTDNDPLVTASGAYANTDIVAARSRDLAVKLPFGTIIEIDGPSVPGNSCGYDVVKPLIGYRIIADSMNSRFTNRVDILFSTKSNYTMTDGKKKNAGTILGICNGANVHIVGFIDLSHPNHLPKLQKMIENLHLYH